MVEFIHSKKVEFQNDKGIYLLGINFDGTACYRKGARLGPNALREASDNLETYSPYLNASLEDLNLFDLGNIESDSFENLIEEFESLIELDLNESPLITFGGEHSISIMPIKAYLESFENLLILQCDAHADLRDEYLGNKNSHACIMKRSLDLLNDQQEIVQYGIRSGTKEEYDLMRSSHSLKNSRKEIIDFLNQIDDQRPIYLTLDVDFFDPSFVPGTGTPEAGGESFEGMIEILKVLNNKNFVGADIVELAPNLDPSGISSCLVSKITREIILSIKSLS